MNLNKIYKLSASSDEFSDETASDILIDYFDNLFSSGKFEEAKETLSRIDFKKLSPKIVLAILMVTSYAKEELAESRIKFKEVVEVYYKEQYASWKELLKGLERHS